MCQFEYEALTNCKLTVYAVIKNRQIIDTVDFLINPGDIVW